MSQHKLNYEPKARAQAIAFELGNLYRIPSALPDVQLHEVRLEIMLGRTVCTSKQLRDEHKRQTQHREIQDWRDYAALTDAHDETIEFNGQSIVFQSCRWGSINGRITMRFLAEYFEDTERWSVYGGSIVAADLSEETFKLMQMLRRHEVSEKAQTFEAFMDALHLLAHNVQSSCGRNWLIKPAEPWIDAIKPQRSLN